MRDEGGRTSTWALSPRGCKVAASYVCTALAVLRGLVCDGLSSTASGAIYCAIANLVRKTATAII